MRRTALAVIAAAACLVSACATTRAVPRPFPGASAPPGQDASAAPPEAATPPPASATPAPAPADPRPVATLERLIATALTFKGTPYRNGGSTPAGFDCSGFVQYVFARHGQSLPREVNQQFKVGERVDRDDVQPGDLVFFQTVSQGASHVGIAIGPGEFVHAPSSRGVVRVEKFTTTYWAQRWVGARRI